MPDHSLGWNSGGDISPYCCGAITPNRKIIAEDALAEERVTAPRNTATSKRQGRKFVGIC
jgi:hypothetical protein